MVAFRPPRAECLGYVGAGHVAERGFPVHIWAEDGLHLLTGEHRPEPISFHVGQVPYKAEQRQARRRYGTLAQLIIGQAVALDGESGPVEVQERGQRGELISFGRRVNARVGHADIVPASSARVSYT